MGMTDIPMLPEQGKHPDPHLESERIEATHPIVDIGGLTHVDPPAGGPEYPLQIRHRGRGGSCGGGGIPSN